MKEAKKSPIKKAGWWTPGYEGLGCAIVEQAVLKLYKHQQLALNYMRFNKNLALFMEQGTGKTIITLFRILELAKLGKIENALIVGPKATMGAWYS